MIEVDGEDRYLRFSSDYNVCCPTCTSTLVHTFSTKAVSAVRVRMDVYLKLCDTQLLLKKTVINFSLQLTRYCKIIILVHQENEKIPMTLIKGRAERACYEVG